MRYAPPGSLLKTPAVAGITLSPSPPLRRLEANLQELIIIAYERSTNRLGSSLSLTKLEYVCGEKRDEKYYMRFDALVQALDHPGAFPLQVNISVEPTGSDEC